MLDVALDIIFSIALQYICGNPIFFISLNRKECSIESKVFFKSKKRKEKLWVVYFKNSTIDWRGITISSVEPPFSKAKLSI
uniref:Uncharacterized protein n=1 Tax=Lepeophtheirus salmonis TaxID=72036 RepID=A0A0K2TLP8_LEPSM